MKKIILPVLIFLALQSNAQFIFFKMYGGTNKEEGKSLAQCSDGGFIIGADVTLIPPAPDSSNVLLVRTNTFGDTLWTRIINSGENDYCVKAIETSDLGIAVLINAVSATNVGKIILIKLNPAGAIQWNKTYSYTGLTGYSFIEKIQGGYLICGAKTYADGLLINTNSLGDTLWTKYYNAFPAPLSSHQPFHDVKQLADSTFIVLGVDYNINIFYPRMFRIGSSGNIMYETQYGANLDDGITLSLARMQQGSGFAFAGSSRTNEWNRFIIKVDSLFNIEWQQEYSLSHAYAISDIVQTQDGGFVFMAGPNSPGFAHCFMIKTNSSGAVSWTKEFQYATFRTPAGEYVNNWLKNLVLTSDNGIAFCGFFLDTITSHNKDLALIKTTINGNTCFDGISAIMYDSVMNYSGGNTTCNVTWGLFTSSSTLTSQSGIPTNNLCFSTSENEAELEENIIQIFPNPTANQFTIYGLRFTISDVEIYNVFGNRIFSQGPTAKSQQQINIDVSDFSPGIYFVRFMSDAEQVVKKLVVQR